MADTLTIALPIQDDRVSAHFGHPDYFLLVSTDPATREIVDRRRLMPPPHQPGVLPLWLAENGVNGVLAGGIGGRARALFESRGIEVVSGVPAVSADHAVSQWLDGGLELTQNRCDHGEEGHGHRCRH
jgi:predicted Fe-Mo cluster-binding NifX family protein